MSSRAAAFWAQACLVPMAALASARQRSSRYCNCSPPPTARWGKSTRIISSSSTASPLSGARCKENNVTCLWFPGWKTPGNCLAERDGRRGIDTNTHLVRQADGTYRLNGQKYYCTGAYLAHWLPVGCRRGRHPRHHSVYVPRHAPGVEVINDWTGIASATPSAVAPPFFATLSLLKIRILRAPPQEYSPHGLVYAQIMHAAIDTGIAQAALERYRFGLSSNNRARPWVKPKSNGPVRILHLIKQFWRTRRSPIPRRRGLCSLRAAELHDFDTRASPSNWNSAHHRCHCRCRRSSACRPITSSLIAGNELFEFGAHLLRFDPVGTSWTRHWRGRRPRPYASRSRALEAPSRRKLSPQLA